MQDSFNKKSLCPLHSLFFAISKIFSLYKHEFFSQKENYRVFLLQEKERIPSAYALIKMQQKRYVALVREGRSFL
jgi:hypothetical protein